MRNKIVVVFLGLSLFACTVSEGTPKKDSVSVDLIQNPVTLEQGSDSSKMARIEFEDKFYSFGELTQGEIVTHSFSFKNTGSSGLVISEARASCGCTVPRIPQGVVKPGETAEIKIKFDSEGKLGSFNKSITIYSNTHPSTTILKISGNIIK